MSTADDTDLKVAESQTVQTIGNPLLHETQNFMEEDDSAPVNPVAIVFRLMRGRWVPLLSLAIFAGLAFAFMANLAVHPLYESEGLVRIIAREQKILFADRDDSRLRLFDAFVDGEATYLQSRAVMDRAYTVFDDEWTEEDGDPVTFKSFVDSLEVKKLKGLIRVASKGRDAEKAQDTVNALLTAYSQMHEEQSGRRQNLRVVELEARIQELLARRSLLEAKLLTIGEEYDASSLARAHLTKVTMLEEIEDRLAEVSNSIARMEAAGSLDADTGDMEIKRATLLDRAMADMVFERAKRASELEQMTLRYQKDHPKVARLIAGLQVIDDAIENRRMLIATLGKTGAITGGDGASASQSLNELVALQEKLRGRRAALSGEARELNSKLIQLAAINGERTEIGSMLADTRNVLDQVLLESRNSLPGTAEILSRGSLPLQPISNKKKALMAAGLLVGAGGVLFCGLLAGFLSNAMRYSDDASSAVASLAPIVTGPLPLQKEDGINRLFAELQFSASWRRDRGTVIAVNSLCAGGQTNLLEIARTAAELNLKSLVMIQTDNPKYFTQTSEGLYRRKGVDFLAVPVQANAALSVKDAAPRIRELTDTYDVILLDTGRDLENATAITLNRIADVRLVLISPSVTKRSLKRFSAQHEITASLFSDARPDDPGLKDRGEGLIPTTSYTYKEAA